MYSIVCKQRHSSVERKLHITMANMLAIFLPDCSVGKGSRCESDICNASRLSTLFVDYFTVSLSTYREKQYKTRHYSDERVGNNLLSNNSKKVKHFVEHFFLILNQNAVSEFLL